MDSAPARERKRPASGWESLTPTELPVARHLAAGVTNPQTAAHMLVSRPTGKSHLALIGSRADHSRFTRGRQRTRRPLAGARPPAKRSSRDEQNGGRFPNRVGERPQPRDWLPRGTSSTSDDCLSAYASIAGRMQKSCLGRRCGHLLSCHDANLARLGERPATRGTEDRAVDRVLGRRNLLARECATRASTLVRPAGRAEGVATAEATNARRAVKAGASGSRDRASESPPGNALKVRKRGRVVCLSRYLSSDEYSNVVS